MTLRDGACKSCRIVAESIAYLGNPEDSVALREDVIPARDSRGRYYLADFKGGTVLVFGPNGRLMKSFGKPGRGPGEFVALRAVFAGKGDTLLVVGGPQVHVISPDYVQVREYRNLGGSIDEMTSTLLADGRILSGGLSRHRFLIVDSMGNVASRVTLAGIDSTPCGECGERVYREAREPGLLWSGPLNTYRIEQHDLTGAFRKRFTRSARWFHEWGPTEIAARNVSVELSRPRLMGIDEASDGLLYAHVSLGENVESLGKVDEDVPKQMAELWARVKTYVEAIDPERGAVLASTKLDGLVVPMTARDYSAQLVVDDAGGWAWKIIRFHVEGRPAS